MRLDKGECDLQGSFLLYGAQFFALFIFRPLSRSMVEDLPNCWHTPLSGRCFHAGGGGEGEGSLNVAGGRHPSFAVEIQKSRVGTTHFWSLRTEPPRAPSEFPKLCSYSLSLRRDSAFFCKIVRSMKGCLTCLGMFGTSTQGRLVGRNEQAHFTNEFLPCWLPLSVMG